MNSIVEQLTPDLGEHVLNVLRRRAGNLPKEGFVAGQAVASALDEILGTGRPVYNDIDVFLSSTQWEEQTGEKAENSALEDVRVSSRVNYYADEALAADSYSQSTQLATRNLYSIRQTRMDGMTNRVLVDWNWQLNRTTTSDKARGLIQVFDANNVQVAVDLQTGLMYHTDAYEQFMASRELRLTQAFTPMQSLLRYFKKREELGVYGNDTAHIELLHRLVQANELSADLREQRKADFVRGRRFFDTKYLKEYVQRDKIARNIFSTQYILVGTGARSMPLVFGPKYKALYDRFADKLEPHFTLTERERGNLWLISSKTDTVEAGAARQLAGNLDSALSKASGGHVVRRFWQLTLAAGKLVTRRRELLKAFLASLKSAETRAAYENAYCMAGDAYLEGCDSEAALEELTRVINEHHEFTFAAIDLPLAQQIVVMRKLKKAFRANDVPDAWGVCLRRTSKDLLKWLDDETVLVEHLRRLRGSKDPLYANKLPLPDIVDGVQIVELTSTFALRAEGTKMRHCVSSYADSVRSESCRIVSFRKGEAAADCATLEWSFTEAKDSPAFETNGDRKVYPLQLVCGQIRSFANGVADAELTALEESLRTELNDWLKANPEAGWQQFRPNVLATRRNPELSALKKITNHAFGLRQMQDEFDEVF
jgi:hypothetical protein